jgi:hypothetical protein
MLAATRSGPGICALSCVFGAGYPQPVELAPLGALIGFITDCAREDRVRLRG